jgi:hypothetical protein
MMNVQNHIVASSIKHCCYGNAQFISLRPIVDLHIALSNINPLHYTTEKQQWIPFVLFRATNFRTVVNNLNALWSSCKL